MTAFAHKPALTDAPLHDLIRNRWSPRGFDGQALSVDDVTTLLEAARWAPSCYNEQPWRYLVATSDDTEGFARLKGLLMDGNSWAHQAGALFLGCAKKTFSHDGSPNPYGWYDLGQATLQLTLQAQALGLGVHQMAGFDKGAATEACAIPDDYEPVVMVAVGRNGGADHLNDALKAREGGPRERKDAVDLFFASTFGAKR